MTVWDSTNLNAPHTEREIAMIEDTAGQRLIAAAKQAKAALGATLDERWAQKEAYLKTEYGLTDAELEAATAEDPGWMAWRELKRLRAEVDRRLNERIELIEIVEGIDGAMNHGTWRDDKGMRLKDTPQWVALYVALATPAPDAVQEAARVLLRELGDYDRDRSHHAFEAANDGYSNSSKPAPFNQIGDAVIAALRAIAGGQP